MRIEVKQAVHPAGGITVFVLDRDSKSYMEQYLPESHLDFAMSRESLIKETIRELEAQLRFNLEMPIADS